MARGDPAPPSLERLFLLRAARTTGVLDALATTAGRPAAVAREAGVTERAARVTVEALAEWGYLTASDDGYELTNRALGFLTKRDLRSVGRTSHTLDRLERLAALPDAMRTGDPTARPEHWTRNRLGDQVASDEAAVRARVSAAVRANPDGERVLDLGGGAGVHAREFEALGFDATLLDETEVVEAAGPLLEATDVTLTDESFEAVEADRFDLVFGVDLCVRLRPGEVESLVATAHEVAAPGGAVALVEPVWGRSDDGPGAAVRGLAAGAGGVYDACRYREWFETEGFAEVEVVDVPGLERQVVAGHKRTVQ